MKAFNIILLSLCSCIIVLYALFWLFSFKQFDVSYGLTFQPSHATSFGLDWKESYLSILNELEPEYLRLSAMWNLIEAEEGQFSFADLDWMMDEAAAHGSQVTLVVGQKAPRWPECHIPNWVASYSASDRTRALMVYIERVVQRYKDHPALESWQVENEAFIPFEFGECDLFLRDSVPDEIDLVRTLDPDHPVLLTDSGELATWRKPSALGDLFGTTLYRVVRTPNGRVVTYDWLPAGFYRLKAALLRISYDRFFVAELQAEPWFGDEDPIEADVSSIEETMTTERLIKHIQFSQHVGASRVYLWGVEWWFFMKEVRGDGRYWEIVRDIL